MSEQGESRMLAEGAALRSPLQRLQDTATEEGQHHWKAARWRHADACSAVFNSCQRLLDVLDEAERVLNRPQPKKR